MKKYFKTSFFLFMTSLAFSQKVDERLLPKFSETKLIEMQKNDPKEYDFLINALNKGVFIGEIPAKKDIKYNGTLKIDPNQKHTFISLGKEITNSYQYYRIEGTNKILGILPRIALDERILIENTKK